MPRRLARPTNTTADLLAAVKRALALRRMRVNGDIEEKLYRKFIGEAAAEFTSVPEIKALAEDHPDAEADLLAKEKALQAMIDAARCAA